MPGQTAPGHFPPAKGAFSSRLLSPCHMDFTSLLEDLPPNGRTQPSRTAEPFRGRSAAKDWELFWSTGVPRLRIRECGLRNSQVVFELRLCIVNPKSEISNPKCDDSSRLPQGGKSIEAPSVGSPKPGPLGPNSLLFGSNGRVEWPALSFVEGVRLQRVFMPSLRVIGIVLNWQVDLS
jgi:hypothetical protein